jgi:DNA helicase HerA-like ATPase
MTQRTLHLAANLTLPLETVTQSAAIIAKRRAGKSYTARRLAEQLIKAGQQVVIVDPKGDHWGIRSARDGRSPGLPVVILGGERGDIPLEVGAGELVAKLVAEDRVTVLLDLSLFRKHEVATFMTAFLETVYRLKAREQNRTPMMLILDEADAIAPQRPQRGEERMLGAAEDIVRRGGQRGLGCTLITQRSAVLNKNVLTQVQILVALRTIAPQDLTALDANGVTREQLTVLTGYRRSSRDTYLQRLTAGGLVANGDRLRVAEAGIAALGSDFIPLPTGRELLRHWLGTLTGGERVLLELVARSAGPVSRNSLGEDSGLKRSSRDTYLQRLAARQLIQKDRDGCVRLSEHLT